MRAAGGHSRVFSWWVRSTVSGTHKCVWCENTSYCVHSHALHRCKRKRNQRTRDPEKPGGASGASTSSNRWGN